MTQIKVGDVVRWVCKPHRAPGRPKTINCFGVVKELYERNYGTWKAPILFPVAYIEVHGPDEYKSIMGRKHTEIRINKLEADHAGK